MWANLRRFLVVGVAAVAVLAVLAVESQAGPRQPAYRVYGVHPYGRGFGGRYIPNSQSLINPAYRVGPNFVPINQAAYNISTLGRAYQNVPPWLYGYNPYPAPIITTPYYPMSSPYLMYNNYGFPGYSSYSSIYP